MPPEVHFDPARLDFSNLVADREAIRRANPQRFEMEQLDAIVKASLLLMRLFTEIAAPDQIRCSRHVAQISHSAGPGWAAVA